MVVVCSQPVPHAFLVCLCLDYVVAVDHYLLLAGRFPASDFAVYSGSPGEKIVLMLLKEKLGFFVVIRRLYP